MDKQRIRKVMALGKPVILDVIAVHLGESIRVVNSWCEEVEVEPYEIPVEEELQCKKCAVNIFRDPETYKCIFACCNYNRMDGKAIRFREKQQQKS